MKRKYLEFSLPCCRKGATYRKGKWNKLRKRSYLFFLFFKILKKIKQGDYRVSLKLIKDLAYVLLSISYFQNDLRQSDESNLSVFLYPEELAYASMFR